MFIAVAIALMAGIQVIVPPSKQAEAYLPAVAASAGFAYFLYSQHLQETRLFNELFRQFNARYDGLNEALNRIAMQQQTTMLPAEDRQTLFDYFNLCAEEYLYFKTGYVDAEVWASWVRGMAYFARVEHIRQLWVDELAGGSYYGFSLALLDQPKSTR